MRLPLLTVLFLLAAAAGVSVAGLVAWIGTAPRWRDQRLVALHLLTSALYSVGLTAATVPESPIPLLLAGSVWNITWGWLHYHAWRIMVARVERRPMRRAEYIPALIGAVVTAGAFVPKLYFSGRTQSFGSASWGVPCRDVVPNDLGSVALTIMVLPHLHTLWALVRAARRGLPEARFFAVAAIAEFIVVVSDIASASMGLSLPYLTPLWMVSYELAVTATLVRRFIADARELDALSNRLEERVSERTRALAEANRVAEAAARAKSDFLAMMSHEIRTPMNGVVGLTDVLLESDLGGEQRAHLETIRRSGLSLLSILNDILDVTKIDSGRLVVERTAYDPRAVATECVELLAHAAREHGTRIELTIEPGLNRRVMGDPARVRQVMLNLVGNAVKFTRDGTVSLRLSRDAGETSPLRCTVTDTGVGIAPEVLPRLFEPFVQADASTTRRFGGTGLGLAISRRLVRAMGGEIGVESVEGCGATFWFTVPWEPAPDEVAPVRTEPKSDVAPRMKVLVAEDNAVNQRVVLAMLSRLGHEARVVPNGREALEALADQEFDLVLMDCQMPEMDGYTATRLLREREREEQRRRTRVVALTANVFEEDRRRAFESGMDGWLTKPLRREELLDALSTAVPANDGAVHPAA